MWSMSGLFAKSPLLSTWPLEVRGPLIAFWRTLFAGLFLLPFVRRPQWTWWLIPTTLFFAAMSVTFLTAMTKTTAANTIWMQHTAPLWVFVIGATLLREPIQRTDWLMLLAVICGVGFILFFEMQNAASGPANQQGVVLALASGFFYATVVLSLRALRQLDPAWLIAMNHLVTAVVLLPFFLQKGVWPTVGQASWLAAFGVLQMGLPYVLFARGVRLIPGHQASFIVLLEPILVPVWVWLAWRHDPTYTAPSWWTFVGGLMILLGLVTRFGLGNKQRP